MTEDVRDDPMAELEHDEGERFLLLKCERRWPLRVLRVMIVVASVLGAVSLACMLLLEPDHPGKSALRWCSRLSILAAVMWLPMLMMSFAWSARVRRNRMICYALAIGLFAVVAAGVPWLLVNTM